MSFYRIEPYNISAEQEQWSRSALGIIEDLRSKILNGEIKPKELIIAFVDYSGGERKISSRRTDQSIDRILGILEFVKLEMRRNYE